MIFSNLKLNKNEPIYIQIKNHVIDSINKGDLKKDSKLPSTREVSKFLSISRNSVIAAYEELESENIIATKRGIGTFVLAEGRNNSHEYFIDYSKSFNKYAYSLKHLDIIKSELPYKKNMISFKSIAPDSSLFNLDDFKRCFLEVWVILEN
ncbi:GntR family transcriptional regulator, partial [Clostridium neonatale]|uniref:GntR family transcriptional regulator n=1 Tax=Clostridium neonatale TaxID=137838 RepID=UPI00293746A6